MSKETQIVIRTLPQILIAAACLAGLPAAAQTLTVTITDVHSSTGKILASLCDDPAAQFPGGCMTAMAMADANIARRGNASGGGCVCWRRVDADVALRC